MRGFAARRVRDMDVPNASRFQGWRTAIKLSRHTGRDCRYPEHREVNLACPQWQLGSGNPCRNAEENLCQQHWHSQGGKGYEILSLSQKYPTRILSRLNFRIMVYRCCGEPYQYPNKTLRNASHSLIWLPCVKGVGSICQLYYFSFI